MRLCARVLRCSRPELCGSRRLCSELCGPRRLCPDVCGSCRVRPDLRRSGGRLCSDLCRSCRCLCSGCHLCSGLQQLLRSQALLQAAQDQVPEDPLLQGSQELLQHGLCSELCRSRCLCSDLCRSGCLRSDLRCSGCRLCSELCRSGGLLPLI